MKTLMNIYIYINVGHFVRASMCWFSSSHSVQATIPVIVSQVLSWGHVCQKSTYLWHGWIIALRFITGHLHGRSFVSNHRKSYCLFTTLFRLTTKKSPKLCVIDALWVESTGNPTPPPPPSVIRKVYACHDITILHGNCFCLIVTQWRQH